MLLDRPIHLIPTTFHYQAASLAFNENLAADEPRRQLRILAMRRTRARNTLPLDEQLRDGEHLALAEGLVECAAEIVYREIDLTLLGDRSQIGSALGEGGFAVVDRLRGGRQVASGVAGDPGRLPPDLPHRRGMAGLDRMDLQRDGQDVVAAQEVAGLALVGAHARILERLGQGEERPVVREYISERAAGRKVERRLLDRGRAERLSQKRHMRCLVLANPLEGQLRKPISRTKIRARRPKIEKEIQ